MKFEFDSPVCLVGHGELSRGVFDRVYDYDYPLFAADGGANRLKDWEIYPKAIIGDLDGLEDPDHFEPHSLILKIEDQNSTDLEKCLQQIDAPLFLCLGFLGKRFDHTLEVLHILLKYPQKKMIFFSGEDVIFRVPQEWSMELPIGCRVSFYPLQQTKVKSSEGFKYPLDDLTFDQGLQIGTSNESIKPNISLVQESPANLLGILPIEHFPQIISQIL